MHYSAVISLDLMDEALRLFLFRDSFIAAEVHIFYISNTTFDLVNKASSLHVYH